MSHYRLTILALSFKLRIENCTTCMFVLLESDCTWCVLSPCREHLEGALRLYKKSYHKEALAEALSGLAYLSVQMGEWKEAEQFIKESECALDASFNKKYNPQVWNCVDNVLSYYWHSLFFFMTCDTLPSGSWKSWYCLHATWRSQQKHCSPWKGSSGEKALQSTCCTCSSTSTAKCSILLPRKWGKHRKEWRNCKRSPETKRYHSMGWYDPII